MGLFSNDLLGITGAYSYSLAHGFISGGLFILVGVLYNRYHTKNIKYYRGLYTLMPLFITLSLFFNLSNLSFPLSLGYLTETMILLSIFQINPFIAFASALACVLLPIVMFTLFQRISFGRLSSHLTTLYNDLSLKELYILLPLLIFNTFLGLSPHYLFDSLTLPLLNLIS
jgi:NADH:ubiquinone oxidoreductase subunit 4 (subunit M)